MSKQVKVNIDDVINLTQMMTTVIQRKGLNPDEFKTVRASWEELVDVITQLQRNTIINKLYPTEPPKTEQPPPSSDLSLPSETPVVATLPTDPNSVAGVNIS